MDDPRRNAPKGRIDERHIARGAIDINCCDAQARAGFVKTPEAIDYCGHQLIRWNSQDEVYLLKKSQMKGAHAELFSYCLYQKVLQPLSSQGQLVPLMLLEYQSVSGTDSEPHILLVFYKQDYDLRIKVVFKNRSFFVIVDSSSFQDRPDIITIFCDSLGFAQIETHLSKVITPQAIESSLLEIAQTLAKASQNDSSEA